LLLSLKSDQHLNALDKVQEYQRTEPQVLDLCISHVKNKHVSKELANSGCRVQELQFCGVLKLVSFKSCHLLSGSGNTVNKQKHP
jgi:hypothetical protein